MALYRNGAFVEDVWVTIAPDAPVPETGAVLVPLKRFRAEREQFFARKNNAAVGVTIAPGEGFDDIAADFAALGLVALVFPKYTDGRAYSTAHRLRTRFAYKGELRAVGDVLLDQLQLMARCGIESFDIASAPTIEALRRGHKAGVTRFYQPGLTVHEAPAGTRPWLRTGAKT